MKSVRRMSKLTAETPRTEIGTACHEPKMCFSLEAAKSSEARQTANNSTSYRKQILNFARRVPNTRNLSSLYCVSLALTSRRGGDNVEIMCLSCCCVW